MLWQLPASAGMEIGMNLMNKLERKFGRYAIPGLMKYIIAVYILGAVIGIINPSMYSEWLMLDVGKVLKGQVWRLITFILYPMDVSFFLFFELYLYYMIGTSLENAWGSFRFNLYYISGILFTIAAAFLFYFGSWIILGVPVSGYGFGMEYINRSMFFAFAALYPNVQFMLFFFIPIKVKYLGYIYGALIAFEVLMSFVANGMVWGTLQLLVILASFANFLWFFFSTRNYRRISPKEIRRKSSYKREVKNASRTGNVVDFKGRKVEARHRCAVCGRTELDDENLEFRFCSKCDGNYEYCMEHLYTHEHVHKK